MTGRSVLIVRTKHFWTRMFLNIAVMSRLGLVIPLHGKAQPAVVDHCKHLPQPSAEGCVSGIF